MAKTIHVSDSAEVGAASKRVITADGFLHVPGKLARTGVQSYSAKDLGIDGEGEFKLYRPPEEVFDSASLASFDGVPLTYGHPPVGTNVTADNWKTYSVGDVRNVGESEGLVTGELIVRHKDAIDAINNGVTQLSNGYRFELDLRDGKTESGEIYHGVQRHIRGNHLAIVKDARGGPELRVADSAPTQEVEVFGKKYVLAQDAAQLVEALRARVDVIDLGEQKALTASKVQEIFDGLRKELDEIKSVVPGTPAYEARLAESIQVRTEAARLVPGIATDGRTDDDIRKETIAALAKSDEKVREALDSMTRRKMSTADVFTALAVMYRPSVAHDAAIGQALLGKLSTVDSQPVGRDLMLARLRNKDL